MPRLHKRVFAHWQPVAVKSAARIQVKSLLRQRIIANRAALPQATHARLSADISARLLRLPQYQAAHCVLGYLSFGAEFDSADWVAQVLVDGKNLLLPKVNRATRELDAYRVHDLETQLAAGAYGIREPLPQHCSAAKLDEVDFILLPGVAFTRAGARLGYGGGYYDKLIARMDACSEMPALVAAAFALQVVADIPQEATDRKVQWLVTEHETIACGN